MARRQGIMAKPIDGLTESGGAGMYVAVPTGTCFSMKVSINTTSSDGKIVGESNAEFR